MEVYKGKYSFLGLVIVVVEFLFLFIRRKGRENLLELRVIGES